MALDTAAQHFVETQVNRALADLIASDPANARYLSALDGATIAVEVVNLPLQLLLRIEQSQLLLGPFDPAVDEAQLRIQGRSSDLLRLLREPLNNSARLRQAGIAVSGDAGLLLELSRLAERIEIDWEQLLSEKLGDMPALLLSRATRFAGREASRTQARASAFIRTQLETRMDLPKKAELDSVKRELRELGYRLDRLEIAAREQPHK